MKTISMTGEAAVKFFRLLHSAARRGNALQLSLQKMRYEMHEVHIRCTKEFTFPCFMMRKKSLFNGIGFTTN